MCHVDWGFYLNRDDFVASRKKEFFQRAEKTNPKLNFPKSFVTLPNELLSRSMDEQTLIDLIYQSMEESARQVPAHWGVHRRKLRESKPWSK